MKLETITTLYLTKDDLKKPLKIICKIKGYKIDSLNLEQGLTREDIMEVEDLWECLQHNLIKDYELITNYKF